MAQVMELKDGRWQVKSLAAFDNERHLQDILLDDPGLVPGCAGAAGVDELWIPGVGAIDVVLVDDAGVITLVECKLKANPEIRRAVIGQVFAYASGLSGTALSDFESRWAGRSSVRAGTSRTLVADVEGAAGSTLDVEVFEEALTQNLGQGRFRLVVAVDEITAELKAIIEYLSQHLKDSVSVLALEVGRIPAGKEAFLVVETYGAELAIAKAQAATNGARRWTIADVKEALKALPNVGERAVVEHLFDMANSRSARVNGGTGRSPSAGVYFPFGGKSPSLWSVYVRDTGAELAFNIGSIANVAREAGDLYRRLVAELIGVPVDEVKPYQQVAVRTLVERQADGRSLIQLLETVLRADTTPPRDQQ